MRLLAHALAGEGTFLVMLSIASGAIGIRKLWGGGFPEMSRRTGWLLLVASVAALATLIVLALHPSPPQPSS